MKAHWIEIIIVRNGRRKHIKALGFYSRASGLLWNLFTRYVFKKDDSDSLFRLLLTLVFYGPQVAYIGRKRPHVISPQVKLTSGIRHDRTRKQRCQLSKKQTQKHQQQFIKIPIQATRGTKDQKTIIFIISYRLDFAH